MSASKLSSKGKRKREQQQISTSSSNEPQQQQKENEEAQSKSKSKKQGNAAQSAFEFPSVSSLLSSAKDDLEKLIYYRDFGKELYGKAAEKAEQLIADTPAKPIQADDAKDTCHVCGERIAKKKSTLPCGEMLDGGFYNLEEALKERGGCGKMCHIKCMQRTRCKMIVLCDDCVDDYDCLDCDECAGY